MRSAAIEKMRRIVTQEDDPLSVVTGWIVDPNLDIQTRLSAASIALPYLYPRLSASTVDTRVTTMNVDSAKVIERLNARLEKLIAEPAPVIEAKPVQIEARPDEPEDEK